MTKLDSDLPLVPRRSAGPHGSRDIDHIDTHSCDHSANRRARHAMRSHESIGGRGGAPDRKGRSTNCPRALPANVEHRRMRRAVLLSLLGCHPI
jgi:hypothetical protein